MTVHRDYEASLSLYTIYAQDVIISTGFIVIILFDCHYNRNEGV